jgi:Ribbon-helix-helix protein, copG family
MAKTTKVLVTMPSELLDRIDRETATLGQTRSEFFQEAVQRRLGWPDPLVVDAALLRGRAALSDVGGFESADVVRAQRDEKDARDQRR